MYLCTAPVLLLLAPALWAQTPGPQPVFEAASIKLDAKADGSDAEVTPGLLRSQMTLARYIVFAYNVKPYQVSGGPNWMGQEHYQIEAKLQAGEAPLGPVANAEAIRAALQSLLAERFQLKFHRESKEMPAYALTVAKSGFKLTPVEGATGGGTSSHGGGARRTLTATTIDMARFAAFLAREIDSPVADETHIQGAFTFNLEWTPDDLKTVSTDGPPLPSLFTALQEQLGLKLDAHSKTRVETIVVDSAERPTGN